MKKQVAALYELCGAIDSEEDRIRFLGECLTIKKAEEIDGKQYIQDILSYLLPSNKAEEIYERISTAHGIKEGTSSIERNQRQIGERKFNELLVTIDKMDTNEIAEAYDEILQEKKNLRVEFLPASIERLIVSMLQIDNAASFYCGCVGTEKLYARYATLTEHIAINGHGNNPSCSIESNQTMLALGRLWEFIQYGKVFTDYADPLLYPPMYNGKVAQYERVFMKGPFGRKWMGEEHQLAMKSSERFKYGYPSLGAAELLYASHVLETLSDTGKGIMLFPSGRLFCGGKDQHVRENMLADDVIEGVIALPAGLFHTFGIPVNLVIFNKNKSDDMKGRMFFINAENMGTHSRTQTLLTDEEIQHITTVYNDKRVIDEFSCMMDTCDIEEANILPSRYTFKKSVEVAGMGTACFDWSDWKEDTDFVELGKISTIYRGINVTRNIIPDENGAYKIINLADVQNGELNLSGLTSYTISTKAKIEDYLVRPGDIVITARGEQTKICCIPNMDEQVLLSQNFYGIRLTSPSYLPEALEIYMESPVGQYLISKQKSGSAIPLLRLQSLDMLKVPVMTLKQQEAAIAMKRKKGEELQIKLVKLQEEMKQLKCDVWNKMGLSSFFSLGK